MTNDDLERSKAVARAFVERVFANGEADALDELATEDFTPRTYGAMPPGREPMKVATQRVGQAIADATFEIEDVIAEGDRVAIRLIASGRHVGPFMGLPASGRRYRIQEIHIFRIRDGQVAEHWHEFDKMSLMQQLSGDAEKR
ncbi:MAG TPA: ester cyclase [Candidatus Limnocylindrales bacterium]|nr:ester cyclase [Candidatus Limnocylindrales bacterium]